MHLTVLERLDQAGKKKGRIGPQIGVCVCARGGCAEGIKSRCMGES